MKKVFLFLACLSILGYAQCERPSSYNEGYPNVKQYPLESKRTFEYFNDGKHWYVCIDDKHIMHDPECPCNFSKAFHTFDLDEEGGIKGTGKITFQSKNWGY